MGGLVGDRFVDQTGVEAELGEQVAGDVGLVRAWLPSSWSARPARSYQASRWAMSGARSKAPIRIIDQPYDHSRSHGCFLPSTRLISSRLKNRHEISMPISSRTLRIHFEVW